MREKPDSDFILDEKTLPIIENICDGMPGGFFIYKNEGDGELIYINKAMIRIFGCESEAEFRKHTQNCFKGIVHRDDYIRVQKSIMKQIKGNPDNLDYVEYRIVRRDGNIRWVEDYGKCVRTTNYGNVFFVFIDDATERMRDRMNELERINNELKKTLARESQYRKAVLYNAYAFFEVNLSKNEIISANFQENVTGTADCSYNIECRSIKKYTDFIRCWTDAMEEKECGKYHSFFNIERLIDNYKNGEPEQVFENVVIDSSGRKRLFQFVFLIGQNEFTKDIIALSVVKDITEISEKKRLFQMALKEANAGNIARQTFLSNISHDIRTPLNSIIGFTELIGINISDENKLKNYLDKIKLSSKQLLEIVNEALEITHMESSKEVFGKTNFSLGKLLDSLDKKIRPDAEKKDIKFILDRSGIRHFNVYTDEMRLEEVLWQILDNAVKYTANGGLIKLKVFENDNSSKCFGCYTFEITDNGIGIDPKFMEKIFEPFKRESNTTVSGILGSGLGLAVAKNIIDMMDGTIDVESSVGKGSRFTVNVTLPLQSCQNDCDSCGKDLDPQFMAGMRILLVDDNEINLEIEQSMLEYCGCIVDTAKNGQEAVKMVRISSENPYDVILMDIQMPVMNGYEAAKAIRSFDDTRLSTVPIIAISANAFEDDREKSFKSGMDAHFAKPIDLFELKKLTKKVLNLNKK